MPATAAVAHWFCVDLPSRFRRAFFLFEKPYLFLAAELAGDFTVFLGPIRFASVAIVLKFWQLAGFNL
ncbi:hypothetical protein FUAX_49130 (plasmid) [Fulvitalea axinellae]|uniref:Uncharacterized protein n=1 Tax=Fulvitalea axinellae TaxID=1182444 RepID=A0AAU9CTW6_9BACT|nr:hypothetical protein FUAX_49130 [Fulvitalea axinellae]